MFYFNDKPVEAQAGITLKEIIKLQGRDPALVIAEVDGRFVPREEYRKLALPEGARVKVWELLDGG